MPGKYFSVYPYMRQELTLTIGILCHCVQEQSSQREIGDLKKQLRSSEKILHKRDSKLEIQRPKVN